MSHNLRYRKVQWDGGDTKSTSDYSSAVEMWTNILTNLTTAVQRRCGHILCNLTRGSAGVGIGGGHILTI